MVGTRNETEYDLYSAITFLLVGLGIGSLLAIVFNPKLRDTPAGIDRWRTSELQTRREAEERVA
jgi:hypothetical protein